MTKQTSQSVSRRVGSRLEALAREVDQHLLDLCEGRGVKEAIHQARVNSRRIVSTVDAAGQLWPDHGLAPRDAARAVVRELGPARDLDVIGDTLYTMLSGRGSAVRGARDVALAWVANERRRSVAETTAKNRSEIVWIVREAIRSSSGATDKEIRKYLAHNARGLVDEVLYRRLRVEKKPSVRRLHKLRVALRRLRYGIEVYNELADRGLEDLLATCETWQDRVGALHDRFQTARALRSVRKALKRAARHDPLLASRHAYRVTQAVLRREQRTIVGEVEAQRKRATRLVRRKLTPATLSAWRERLVRTAQSLTV